MLVWKRFGGLFDLILHAISCHNLNNFENLHQPQDFEATPLSAATSSA